MNRAELEPWIAETYNADAEHPWAKFPDYAVFRHANNRKWFALVMDAPRAKLGLAGDGNLCVVNLKCDPIVIGSLRGEPGIYPAYHMNKDSWISAALDGSVPEGTLKMLLDMSFALTAGGKRKAKK